MGPVDFSEDVLLGIEAAKTAALGALFQRHALLDLAARKDMHAKKNFSWTKEDGSDICFSDIISTVHLIKPFVKKYGPIPIISEEKLDGWSEFAQYILPKSDYGKILNCERGLVIDGIDGSTLFLAGSSGCGIWFTGIRDGQPAWAIFLGLPDAVEAIIEKKDYRFICVAERGKGSWVLTENGVWEKGVVCPWPFGIKPKLSIANYHTNNPQYRNIRQLHEYLSQSVCEIYSIGQAIADTTCLRNQNTFLHGELFLHDRIGAEVFVPESGGCLYRFVTTNSGFTSFGLGFGSDYISAHSRIGVLFGNPELVDFLAQEMENPNSDCEAAARHFLESRKPQYFFSQAQWLTATAGAF